MPKIGQTNHRNPRTSLIYYVEKRSGEEVVCTEMGQKEKKGDLGEKEKEKEAAAAKVSVKSKPSSLLLPKYPNTKRQSLSPLFCHFAVSFN